MQPFWEFGGVCEKKSEYSCAMKYQFRRHGEGV